MLSQDAQPDVSAPRVLPEDGRRERWDEGDVRRARDHGDAGPWLFVVWTTGTCRGEVQPERHNKLWAPSE